MWIHLHRSKSINTDYIRELKVSVSDEDDQRLMAVLSRRHAVTVWIGSQAQCISLHRAIMDQVMLQPLTVFRVSEWWANYEEECEV